MKKHPVGFRYASALFEYAQENSLLDSIQQELDDVTQVFQETNLLDEVFKHSKMTSEEKKKIVRESFSSKVSDAVLNLLQILIDNRREQLYYTIAESYRSLVFEAKGIAEATVYTAKALSEEEKQAISQVFSKKANKNQLLINNVVDKDIIGGMRLRIGDSVYDGSVANQLARIQQRMMYGNVSR
ncbi:F0F1 ATP synthase subunit delta [Evansella cellulosilytica]|uniref:ATP synthase subunit delta n=1 Tax=Evansella cellulosilytica (strain ATCC 21833 / DSM 2522 / FERM P-1141 / JCM 9156 / N-4) TaxID=649639 RepID=E6TXA6_EVAC2|nr:F0F1 ATP synthase subunit delta [Evansella cellulosilytica]ADU32301.1 ATP synthase F1, delta subunit [Evansella cellulosilytica DSM 2522]